MTECNCSCHKYNIVRLYESGRRRIIRRNVTRAEAQHHCSNPETSSRTCKSVAGRRRTKRYGQWFDGFTDAK